MVARQRPIAATGLGSKATRAAWKAIPSWTMVALQDLAIPLDGKQMRNERARICSYRPVLRSTANNDKLTRVQSATACSTTSVNPPLQCPQ